MKPRATKWVITVGALLVVGVRMIWPALAIDAVALGLLGLAVLPWLSGVIKSAELPGGWKVEFRDLQEAGQKVTAGIPDRGPIPAPSYLAVASIDPNLALVGLRIEIEKRVRELAGRYGLADNRSLTRMIEELRMRGVLRSDSASGLRDLIQAGNQAAHGADVDGRATQWAMDYGPEVLAALESSVLAAR